MKWNEFICMWLALVHSSNHRTQKEFHLTLAFVVLSLACKMKYLHSNNTHSLFLHSKTVRITQVIKRSETEFVSHIYNGKSVCYTSYTVPSCGSSFMCICVREFLFVFISNKSYTAIVFDINLRKSIFSCIFQFGLVSFCHLSGCSCYISNSSWIFQPFIETKPNYPTSYS